MQFLQGTDDGAGHRCCCLMPRVKNSPASSRNQEMDFKHQQGCLGSHLPQQRCSGRGRKSVQRAGQSSHAYPINGRSIAVSPGSPGQISALGNPPGLCLWPSQQQINMYIIRPQRLVTMWIGSLSISQGLGLSFPFRKAQSHPSARKQAGQEKAKGQ